MTSLMSSPPPCKLVGKGQSKQQKDQEKRGAKVKEQPSKLKELRLTAHIEDHDYDTKVRQAVTFFASGNGFSSLYVSKAKGDKKQKSFESEW